MLKLCLRENSGREISSLLGSRCWGCHVLKKNCAKETRKCPDYRDATVFKNLSAVFKLFSEHTKMQIRRFQSVFEKLHFLDGLVWTVDLTGETKVELRFQISTAYWERGPGSHHSCMVSRVHTSTHSRL